MNHSAMDYSVSEAIPTPNRIRSCPGCGGHLRSDKNACTMREGDIYRARLCERCGAEICTRQAPEIIQKIIPVREH